MKVLNKKTKILNKSPVKKDKKKKENKDKNSQEKL